VRDKALEPSLHSLEPRHPLPLEIRDVVEHPEHEERVIRNVEQRVKPVLIARAILVYQGGERDEMARQAKVQPRYLNLIEDKKLVGLEALL